MWFCLVSLTNIQTFNLIPDKTYSTPVVMLNPEKFKKFLDIRSGLENIEFMVQFFQKL